MGLRVPSSSGGDKPAPSVLEVNNLQVEFATRSGVLRAVDRVSFSLGESQTLAILGESGSGKTATALAIMGLLPQPAGRVAGGKVVFRGHDLLAASEAELQEIRGERVAMIFQDPLSSLNPVLSVGFQISEMFRRHRGIARKEAEESAIELMERVRIPEARKRVHDHPHQFSGGMRQRIMIAIALALDPDVLIADEPTTALDVTVQAQILDLLSELQEERRMALVLITHDLGVIAGVAKQVMVMYAGRVVESGPTRQVYTSPAHPYTVGLLRSVPRAHRRSSQLDPISGSPPDMLAVPPGCPFHPRCFLAQDVCRHDEPPLRGVQRSQISACHFAEEVLSGAR